MVTETHPELIAEARRFRHKKRASGKQKSYQRFADELFAMGFSSGSEKPYQRVFIYRILK